MYNGHVQNSVHGLKTFKKCKILFFLITLEILFGL